MSTTATPIDIDIPNFGKVPVQVNQGREPGSPVELTHRPPAVSTGPDDPDFRLRFKNPRIVRVNDLKWASPQYAVRQQKVLMLNRQQLDALLAGTLTVETRAGSGLTPQELTSLNRERASRIVSSDCPDPDSQYTVLLDWDETTSVPFPDLGFRDAAGNITEPISQTNNYLVVSDGGGGTHNPPAPPITASAISSLGPLNTQPSDFRPATPADIQYYRQQSGGQNNGLAVAVMDTGLKYNILNAGQETEWPDPYMYRDADGQERRFTLAYQHQPNTDCGPLMANNYLGYCALLSYRDPGFMATMKPLATTVPVPVYTSADVMNSPFDDARVFRNPPDASSLVDARHGTSVTALIQQNGDDAPVLPVKVFDNIGFATLFDVLNGFNYILNRCQTTPIRVVNASWIFGQDNPLLRRKIEQLGAAGVFVVAAAGNEGQTDDRNLDVVPVYPACYSQVLPNVITVTSVRKTYFRPDFLKPKQDSVIGNLLRGAIDLGLFKLLEGADDVVGAVLPTAGYVAVENYSTTYVNVGVVSTFGYFRSPFWNSSAIRGSSFACAFVTGFIIRQLRSDPALLPLIESGQLAQVRQALLEAMNGEGPDENLKNEYVNGGYYLNGYAVD